DDRHAVSRRKPDDPQVETTPRQDPFQPSSTPLEDARRYLCWNRVGTIISVDEVTRAVCVFFF
ncbi:unnamed protein product, partial [Ectocarpus sp. 12 AP-2014]